MFVAGALGKTTFREPMPARFWFLALACSVVPDVDVIGYQFGIRYRDVLGHRGLSHSLFFALLAGLLVVTVAFPAISRFSKKWWSMVLFFFAVTASHGFLDSLTDKGLGVAFFSPFDTTRHFLFWRPIQASPMAISRFFSETGLRVMVNEMIWIWTPMALLYVADWLMCKRTRH
jgi:inner membrane protein